jgi:hypothetical protein
MAALLLLLATVALVPAASAQVCSGQLIKFDADAFAWEDSYAGYVSSPGSNLKIVGIITQFCPPLGGLDPSDPTKEYTFLMTALVSSGTVVTPLTGQTNYRTNYGGGTFHIYEGSPRNAPTAGSMPCGPGGGTVPANFTDGTLILEGTLSGFRTSFNVFTSGQYSGVWRADYTFTGGSLFALVAGTGTGLMGGNWSVDPAALPVCLPGEGYTAHPDGKWDVPPTPTTPSTWGSIKSLYR